MVSYVYVLAKYKDEVPHVSVSNQNAKLKLIELKALFFKSTEQLAKMNVCNSNTKLWNFNGGDIILDYEFLLPILNASTVSTDGYYSKCYKVANWCKKTFKSLYYILAHLTGVFQNSI